MHKVWLMVIVCFFSSFALEAFADPPAHAPAHGWRKKHDPYYVGYTGTQWERDYDVASGRCNREAIGAVLGGVAGGVIGSQVSSRENRTVATIIGGAVGALIGAKIGRELDEGDRGCMGHALEIAKDGQRVTWSNSGARFELFPGEGKRSTRGMCREFKLVVTAEEGRSKKKGVACQNQIGVWKLVSA